MSELDKLKKKLIKVEAELNTCRTSVLQDGWQTQRFAKKSRKWDVLAVEKFNLQTKIEEYENSVCVNEKV